MLSLKRGRDIVWDGFFFFIFIYLLIIFLFHVDEHCEMRCDKPEPWYENLNRVAVLDPSLSKI